MSCKVYVDGLTPERFYDQMMRNETAYEEKRFIELISDNGYFIIENNKINKYSLVDCEAEIKECGDRMFIIDKSFYKKVLFYNKLPINCIERCNITRKYKLDVKDATGNIFIVVEGNEQMYNFIPNNFYFLVSSPATNDLDTVCDSISHFLDELAF